MKAILQNHLGAIIYVLILLGLNIGVITYTGVAHIDKMALVTITFIGFYVLFSKYSPIIKTKVPFFSFKPNKNIGIYILAGISLTIFILDFIYTNGLPGFSLFKVETTSEVLALRQGIHVNSPKWMIYLSSFNLKGFFPFCILLLYITKRTALFWIFTIIGVCYSFGLLQKSYIISMILPSLIYTLINKKYWVSAGLLAAISLVIVVLIAGPAKKIDDTRGPVIAEQKVDQNELPLYIRVVIGLNKRIFLVPGEMVASWFDLIPEKKPYLYGAGYPLLPKLLNKENIDYNKVLYPLIRPQYAERGLSGSVNTATFMREYSNFGYIGLVISSLFMSLFLLLLQRLFQHKFALFTSLNLMYILLLSSSNLWTLLVSGGWLITILLFIIYKDILQKSIENEKH